jgi:thiamine biosynthesis lipoprotein
VSASRLVRRQERVMGTVATVEAYDPPDPRILDEVFAWLHDVDRRFSTYRTDSEVNRLDRRDVTLASCSDDLRYVLDQCARLWRETDGYFDVYATGRLDPSGYVKGWSVQRASELLTAAGATAHLVDAGGDIQARHRPAPDQLWEIGVRHPWERDRVSWVLAGTDLAVATSGTYERGTHVIDPRTGVPATTLVSVTVVGRDLGDADAYATAALAMGMAALEWLPRLDGYTSALVAWDGTCFVSDAFPVRRPDSASVTTDDGGFRWTQPYAHLGSPGHLLSDVERAAGTVRSPGDDVEAQPGRPGPALAASRPRTARDAGAVVPDHQHGTGSG